MVKADDVEKAVGNVGILGQAGVILLFVVAPAAAAVADVEAPVGREMEEPLNSSLQTMFQLPCGPPAVCVRVKSSKYTEPALLWASPWKVI